MSYAVHTLIPMAENETMEDYNKKNATKVRKGSIRIKIISILHYYMDVYRFAGFMILPMFYAA